MTKTLVVAPVVLPSTVNVDFPSPPSSAPGSGVLKTSSGPPGETLIRALPHALALSTAHAVKVTLPSSFSVNTPASPAGVATWAGSAVHVTFASGSSVPEASATVAVSESWLWMG